jgi:UDP-3-O-[3-hydroxymyristoyl] glucosamine N-acyltransferase
VKLKDLQLLDPSLKLISNPTWPGEILAISSLGTLVANSFVFVRNAKFYQLLTAVLPEASNLRLGAIVDEKFFNLATAAVRADFEQLAWVATSPNVALSLTTLSKPFYDRKLGGLNTQVDGRQMGTTQIDPSAYISQNVFIGENVTIGPDVQILPGAVILPHSEIGAGTHIFPNVTIYPYTKIGQNCRIHAGTTIVSDGFGYTFHQGQHLKIWHSGGVEIHDDVEIGSNCSIDMGTFSPTMIGPGTRVDNLVQIAHNVKIGRGCVLCGQCGIAGSAVLEDYVVLGGRAAIGPDAHIGSGTQVAGGAKVNEGAIWPAGSKLGGHPAKDLKEWMKGVAYVRSMSLKEKSKE